MDPEAFIRLSIGSLQLRVPRRELTAVKSGYQRLTSPCSCEIRLSGFPLQTTSVPLVSSPESIHGSQNATSIFYLEKSDLKALLTPRRFYAPHSCLEIIVFSGQKGFHCGKRQKIGTFKLKVGPEWGKGKPVILFNGWIGIGKGKRSGAKPEAELYLCIKLDPDPRYVFQFADETKLSPQIVQLQGTIRQPIFSCKFSQDRLSYLDSLNNFWSFSADDQESERRERKGWKVKIHDLSGSAIAAAFITNPFVPSSGCDWVARSNPGSWMIVRPDNFRPDNWQPWGKLEAWRERHGVRDLICYRFHLLPEVHDGGGGEILMLEVFINSEKGGEFSINVDRQVQSAGVTPVSSPRSSGDLTGFSPVVGGFVMSCRVQGERRSSKPYVQLAMRHISCAEDAAIFMALAAAVDLSIEACRPFERKISRRSRHSW